MTDRRAPTNLSQPSVDERIVSRRNWLLRTGSAAGAGLLLPHVGWTDDTAAAESIPSSLIVHSEAPLNAEPPLDKLVENWITPTELFYVRSHAATNPEVDPQTFRLTVDGDVRSTLALSLRELTGRFPAAEVAATMCCAGNRREEHSQVKPVDGVQWSAGALGNAQWGGVRLADVLKHAGIRGTAKHVWFEGLDRHEKNGEQIVFGGSIPLDRVLDDDPAADVLIATIMNGEPLTPDHGAPLRTVVPGYIGARSVKWLARIHVSDRPSNNYYVDTAYRLVTKTTPKAWRAADILYELPLQSVICAIEQLPRQQLRLKGYALPPGDGSTIARVEISIDEGRTWRMANLQRRARPYCWQFWTVGVRSREPVERVLVRAIDSNWRMQPETVAWNAKGYMMNAWHAVQLDG